MKLHVQTYGSPDDATVLMLHGSGAPPASLASLAEELAQTHRVVLPHRNGYGRTAVYDYSPEEELAALSGLVGDAFAIVGHSFGTYRAFQLAARESDRTEKVVAVGPIAGLPEEAREAVAGLVDLIRSGADLSEAAAARWATPAYLAEHPEFVDVCRAWLEDVDDETMALENLEVLDGGETLSAFAASGVPARMYVGELDQATPPALAEAIAAHVEDATVTTEPAMGHVPMVEDFSGLSRWVREALAS